MAGKKKHTPARLADDDVEWDAPVATAKPAIADDDVEWDAPASAVQKTADPSVWERVKGAAARVGGAVSEAPGQIVESVKQMGHDAVSLGERLVHSPARTVNVLTNDFMDGISGGAWRGLSSKIDEYIPGFDERNRDVSDIPQTARIMAHIGGSLTPYSAATVAGRVGARVAGALPRVLQPVVSGAVGGGLAGAQEAASDAGASGATVAEQLKAAYEGSKGGAAMGAGMSLAGQAAGGAARLSQRALRGTSDYVKTAAEARDAGFYDSPEYTELPGRGDKRVQASAERGRERIIKSVERGRAKDNADYGEATRPVMEGRQTAPADVVMDTLLNLHSENLTSAGTHASPEKAAALRDLTDRFIKPHIETGSDEIPLRDLVMMRREVQKRAEFGQPITKDNRPYRELYGSINETLHRVSPELKAADAKLTSGKAARSRINDVIFGSTDDSVSTGAARNAENPAPDAPEAPLPSEMEPLARAATERRGASNVRFAGELNTKAGQARASQFREIAKMDPEVRRALEQQAAVMSREVSLPTVKAVGGEANLAQLFGVPRLLVSNARAAAYGADKALGPMTHAAGLSQASPQAASFLEWLDARAAEGRERQRMLSEKVKGAHRETSR